MQHSSVQERGPDRSVPLVLIGLGNPGPEYLGSRHNVGFTVADQVVERLRRPVEGSATGAFVTSGSWKWRKVHVLKPNRFMNLSGDPVRIFLERHQLTPMHCLVVVDDLDLPPGTLRIRRQGSSGGQKGLEDIISALGTPNIARCRIGIGRPEAGQDVSKHVLERPAGQQKLDFERSLTRATESVLCWLVEGVLNAARRYNGPLPGPEIEIPEGLEN